MSNSHFPFAKLNKPALKLVGGGDFEDSGICAPVNGIQMGLFPRSERYLASFFHVAYFDRCDFLETIFQVRPRFLLDVRRSPSFRSLDLDRRKVFSELDVLGSEYIDVPGIVGYGRRCELVSDMSPVPRLIKDLLVPHLGVPLSLMFLYDSVDDMDCYARGVNPMLSNAVGRDFELEVFMGSRPW
ncbi:hypothetical protein [Stenotrophomonas sp. TD3]|uniref:hypothetical protein n=1 Tax=Stenotrophomonas sp. TD3 TaxID=1641707 RepID=UPI0011150697|nr:hypothetical protein [Stenotrophomonas sp. TD3]